MPVAQRRWFQEALDEPDARRSVALHAGKTQLRVTPAAAADVLWSLTPDLYLRLVHNAGWSPRRYERWLDDTLARTLLP